MGFYSIVDNRAWTSLKVVTEEFKKFSPIKNRENNRIDLDGAKFGISSWYSSYKIVNKWMGRVYHFKWNCIIEDQKPNQEYSIKLKYGGLISGKEPQFYGKNCDSLIKLLNREQELRDICRTIDFEKLELTYSTKEKAWRLEFWPNYGDFIWILIPPVRYFRKPNADEIEKTMRLVKKINNVIKKGEFL
ncbi:hypothetical protein [Bacillus salipaludis]|uniref:hypothetical protein n=1 Tax=Bacillus salipaludis TaxID=2547811 RepID=UPI002E1CFD48|nr:hypothetical protein [Bacillus salipaludis]